MSPKKIAITGAPGTGKTVVIERLEAMGFRCFHEIIRTMTAAAKHVKDSKTVVSNPLVFVDDPYKFNFSLLEGRINHFKRSEEQKASVVFFDRGIPDVLAYMDYFKQEYGETFIDACKDHKYDYLFMMPPWKEIYVSDDERLETFEEAEALHQCLMDTYQKFGYEPILVPKNSIDERITFILNKLKLI